MKKVFSVIILLCLMVASASTFAYLEPENTAEEIFREGFENGFGQCSAQRVYEGTAIEHVTENAYKGVGAIKLTDESTTKTSGMVTPYFEVTPGETYTASFFMNNLSGLSTRIYFSFYDENKEEISYTSFLAKETGWKSAAKTMVAPANAKYARLRIAGTSTDLGVCLVDEVAFHKGTYTPPIIYPVSDYTPPVQADPQNAYVVAPEGEKLVYNAYNEEGDTLSDFSYAGFYEGQYLPPESENLETVETLSPSGSGDDTEMIQSAIDRHTSTDGTIRIIKLKAGKYYINSNGIKLKSGILLSGEGQGPNGTIIYPYEPTQYKAIYIHGSAFKTSKEYAYITDEYLASGSREISIEPEKASLFKVGDKIAIYHSSTQEWVEALKMVNVPSNSTEGQTTWKKGTVVVVSERTVTAVSGDKITVDYGVFMPHIKEYVPSYIKKITDDTRVMNVGVENLRIESYYNGSMIDENHATSAIEIKHAKDIFIRNVTSKYFYFGLAQMDKGSKNVTVENCSCLEPISQISGSRRYSFWAGDEAQSTLVSGCYSYDARHDYATSTQASGPIVFMDSVAEMSNSSSETHMNWATGVLYDNLYQIGSKTSGMIAIANRGIYQHGWSGSNCVVWNGLANAIVVAKPPLSYNNLAVGVWGLYGDEDALEQKRRNYSSYKSGYRTGEDDSAPEGSFETDDNTPMVGDGYKESKYAPVEPRSLFKAQLAERFTGSYKNARPNAPILTNPYPDLVQDKTLVTVTGIYQKGAEKVTVYIDNTPYSAVLNEEENTFELTLNVAEGTHKIYATQTIDGIEGNKTADRFVNAKIISENAPYLESIYPKEKMTLLVNDTRASYDEIVTVKFETNGAAEISDVKAVKGKELAFPEEPTKDGYSFDGWYLDEDFETKYDFSAVVSKEFTLYAKWTERTLLAEAEAVGDDVKLTVTVKKEIVGKFIPVAVFDAENKLLAIDIVPTDKEFQSKEILFENVKDASFVKIFVWETSANFVPIEQAEKIEVVK